MRNVLVGCLDPTVFKDFKLVKRTQINHNSARFRFALPTPTSVLGLHAGQFIRCRGIDREGKEVIRPYTPITLNSDVGYFELVVKVISSVSQHANQVFFHLKFGLNDFGGGGGGAAAAAIDVSTGKDVPPF
ncbi:hypothetical protein RJ640_006481 [Escallonia rubra]|uniref:cytochrome-b5 reductase n=1 Tax=Escallonia rubra TaxID=112253 RepID=A0AA88RC76_9ASTE|nr:hypothetical protein RJ640_006481 [Escallonia rubra]